MASTTANTEWDPSPYLLPDDSAVAPPHAVILLNSPMDAGQKPYFEKLWKTAKLRLCADGAANRLIDTYGVKPFLESHADSNSSLALPDAIVGDLDSIRDDVKEFFTRRAVQVLHRPSLYATDLQKCIQTVEDYEQSNSIPELVLIIYGGLAGRLDQSIHTLHVLWQLAPGADELGGVEEPDEANVRGGKLLKRQCTFVIGDGSVAWLLVKGKHKMTMSRSVMGKTCGILALGVGIPGARVKTEGLEWNLNYEPSTLGGFLSTSNHLADPQGKVTLETDQPVYWTVELQPQSSNPNNIVSLESKC